MVGQEKMTFPGERHNRSGFAPDVIRFMLIAGVSLALVLVFFAARAYRHPTGIVILEGDWTRELDREIGFVPVKNGSSRMRNLFAGLSYDIFTDDRGGRVNSPGLKAPGRVDLLTLGCSFAWGQGVDNRNTYTERLGRRLGLAVENLAVPEYGTVQSLLMLERNAALKPRVVVYGIIEDHLRRNLSPCVEDFYARRCVPVPYVALGGGEDVFLHEAEPERVSMEEIRKYYRESLVETYPSLNSALWQIRRDYNAVVNGLRHRYKNDVETRSKSIDCLLRRMNAECRGLGARFVVVFIPYLRKEQHSAAPAELIKALKGRKVPFLDLTAAVNQHYKRGGGPLHFEKDDHPNEAAHALIAVELEKFMRRNRLLRRSLP